MRRTRAAARHTTPATAGNLGALERLAQADAPAGAVAAAGAAAPPDLSAFATPHLDGPVAAVSIALLLLLLAISSDRILGFDLAAVLSRAWLERRALARRAEAIEGRARLEASFDNECGGGDVRGGGSGDPGGG